MRILSNHPPRANRTAAHISGLWWAVCLLFLLPQGGHGAEGRADFIPLPDSVLIPKDDPASGTAKMAIQALSGSSGFRLPDSLVIHNEDGNVVYDQEKGTINYTGDGKKLLYVRTGEGHEIYASEVRIKMDETVAEFVGPLVIYYGDTLTYAESGSYDWQIGYARANKIRAKVQGMLVRGSAAEYKKDSKGRTYMVIHDGYLSSEDVRVPQMWVGTGELTVYPGDYGRVSRLSIATAHHEMRVPILGWLPITHSLNPEEGYMPMPGAKSIWGIYLCNRYGFLLGNRRTDGAVPTADYLATALLDYFTASDNVDGDYELKLENGEIVLRGSADLELAEEEADKLGPDVEPEEVPFESGRFTVDDSAIDYNTVGEYTDGLIVKVTDKAGNQREAKYTVYIYDKENTVPPTLQLKEGDLKTVNLDAMTEEINWGNDYVEKAEDVNGIDIKNRVSADVSDLDVTTEGEYPVTIYVEDFVGNRTEIPVTLQVKKPE